MSENNPPPLNPEASKGKSKGCLIGCVATAIVFGGIFLLMLFIASQGEKLIEKQTTTLVEEISNTEGEERMAKVRQLLELDPDTTEFPDEVAIIRNEEAEVAAIKEKAKVSQLNEDSKNRVSGITWSEYDAIYDVKSKYTKLQKEKEWEKFKGKTIEWTGEVAEVKDGALGGLQIWVKMDRDTFTFDVRVDLHRAFENEAMKLKVGDSVTFRGELSSWGTMLPSSVRNGVIVD